jgi:hypothetical protein
MVVQVPASSGGTVQSLRLRGFTFFLRESAFAGSCKFCRLFAMAHQQRLIAPKEAASEWLLGTAEMDVGSWSGLDESGPVRALAVAPVCSSLQTLRQRGGPPNQREATWRAFNAA